MPNQPFLVFPRPIPATRAKLGSGPGPKFRKPTPAQQKGRLEERFQEIAAAFKDIQGIVAGVEPEQVIVLETDWKSVEGLAKAAAKIPGLEWLAERDLDEVEPEFNFQNEDQPDAKLPRRLYALFSNQQAMDALVALWRNWTAYPDRRAARNFGPFKEIFAHLRDIRRWGPRDRIADTGIVAQWQEDIAVKGAQGTILFEVELWFRSNADKQQEVYDEVSALVIEAGGQCLDSAAISEISYHAILAELPADVIEKTINQLQAQEYSKLLRSEGVMFLRPQARTHFDLLPLQNTPFNFEARLVGQPGVEGPPIVALFDGLPLENHRALAGRLILDDPDGYAQLYASGEQHHGTAMASLILHGDLNGSGKALRRPLYARPILHPADYGKDERTPSKRLLVDLIHRAGRR